VGIARIYAQCYYTACLTWTKDGSKRVILNEEGAFGGVNNVPLSFERQTLKN